MTGNWATCTKFVRETEFGRYKVYALDKVGAKHGKLCGGKVRWSEEPQDKEYGECRKCWRTELELKCEKCGHTYRKFDLDSLAGALNSEEIALP